MCAIYHVPSSILHEAAEKGDVKTVKEYIASFGTFSSVPYSASSVLNSKGEPLVVSGSVGCLCLLTQRLGVAIPDSAGWTPLMHACFYGKFDVASALLSSPQTNVNIFNSHGHNAVFYLVREFIGMTLMFIKCYFYSNITYPFLQ